MARAQEAAAGGAGHCGKRHAQQNAATRQRSASSEQDMAPPARPLLLWHLLPLATLFLGLIGGFGACHVLVVKQQHTQQQHMQPTHACPASPAPQPPQAIEAAEQQQQGVAAHLYASCPAEAAQAAAEPDDCSRIRHVVVLGERHSGTNLLEKLLKYNLDLQRVAVRSSLTSHKHFEQPPSSQRLCSTLVVVGVRNVYDWLRSMYRVCHCCEHMVEGRPPFADFLRAKYWPVTTPASVDDCHLDIDLSTGQAFANVLAMRAAKYVHWLGLADQPWGPAAVELVRWEEALMPEQQAQVVQQLAQRYSLPLAAHNGSSSTIDGMRAVTADARSWLRRDTFDPVMTRNNSVYLNWGAYREHAKPRASVRLINSLVNTTVERNVLGYGLLDVPTAREERRKLRSQTLVALAAARRQREAARAAQAL